MNTLKVHGLLSERYSTHFLSLVQTLTRPVFGTPCSYSNTVMKSPLREKIQNAINRSVTDSINYYHDYNNNGHEGALIVGGRRRNRKRKNKKNGQKKKKSPSLENIKARLSPSGCRKGGQDKLDRPLIDESVEEEAGEENQADKENMPFDFFKRKKKDSQTKDAATDAPSDTNSTPDGKDPSSADTGSAVQHQEQQQQQQQHEGVVRAEPVFVEPPHVVEQQKVAQQPGSLELESPAANGMTPANEGTSAPEEQGQGQPPLTKKSEKSPLIGKDGLKPPPKEEKESKVKDSSPGFLCCTIL